MKLVERVIGRKKDNIDASELENKIDKIVYRLYGISDNEKKIIEKYSSI